MKKRISAIVLSVVIFVMQIITIHGAEMSKEVYSLFLASGAVGFTTYTDILAYINNYLIESYNIDGYTVVIAEDLANYGFNVVWSEEKRTLNITRNHGQNKISQYSVPYETAPNMVGKQALPVYSTDIKTYVNGVEARSYNIDGRTVVDIESLGAFGLVNWEPDFRYIKVWIEDGLKMLNYVQKPQSLPKTVLYSANGDSISVYDYEVDDYIKVGWYKTRNEANAAANAEKNKAAANKFYIGQNVVHWKFVYTRYGIVRDIDESSGKVKVYWNKVLDPNGYDMRNGVFYGLYSESWIGAGEIGPLY